MGGFGGFSFFRDRFDGCGGCGFGGFGGCGFGGRFDCDDGFRGRGCGRRKFCDRDWDC